MPDSTDEDAIMSVKDIVKKMTTRLLYMLMYRGQSQGSGFFIKDGVIVTNYHVIEGGKVLKSPFQWKLCDVEEFYTLIPVLISLY